MPVPRNVPRAVGEATSVAPLLAWGRGVQELNAVSRDEPRDEKISKVLDDLIVILLSSIW